MRHRADTDERGRRRAAGLPRHRASRLPVTDRVGTGSRSAVMTAALLAGVGVAGLAAAASANPASPVNLGDVPLDPQIHVNMGRTLPLPGPDGVAPSTSATGTPSADPSVTIAAQQLARAPRPASTGPASTGPATTRAAAPVRATRKPVAKPAWVNPMPDGTVTSCFGPRWGRLHAGVDLAAAHGTPIVAAGAGTVVSAGANFGGYGISVLIQHANGYLTHYAHMSKTVVKPGDRVRAGQHIGDEGSTGHSTGPHLHFEVHQGAWRNAVEPAAWLHAHGVDLPGCTAAAARR